MLTLTDPILKGPRPADGIELPPLHEPETLETPTSYVSSGGVRVMTSKELADASSAALPPAPRFDRFGERVSHMTGRFVLSGSSDGYQIRRFQSAAAPIEFPATQEGWALAWTTFRGVDSSA